MSDHKAQRPTGTLAYADQNERDYEAFLKAVKGGVLPAEAGVRRDESRPGQRCAGLARLLATVPVISPLGSCSRRFFLTVGGERVDDQHAYEDVG